VLFLLGRLAIHFSQCHAVVFAETIGQGVPLQPDFVGGKLLGVDLLLDLADPGMDPLGGGGPLGSLRLEGLALLDQADGATGR
jgi:hypothetical protein